MTGQIRVGQALDVVGHRQVIAQEGNTARIWRHNSRARGKRDEARQLPTEVYSWFTRGFDTTDLQEVTALLGELF